MVGWHQQLDGHVFGYTPGVGNEQGGLVCCSPWSCKESDKTEWLNWIELNLTHMHVAWSVLVLNCQRFEDYSSQIKNIQILPYVVHLNPSWPFHAPYWSVRPLVTLVQVKSAMSLQFSSVAQSCLTLYDCSTPGLPVHRQLLRTYKCYNQVSYVSKGPVVLSCHSLKWWWMVESEYSRAKSDSV